MFKLIFILFAVFLISCSDGNHKQGPVINSISKKPLETIKKLPEITTIRAIFNKDKSNRIVGDFINVHYEIETYVNKVVLQDKMQCSSFDRYIECLAKTDLNNLPAQIYRILVKNNTGLLGSDLFEIAPNLIPVTITIDNESTGMYILSILKQKTGLSEDVIYSRLHYILGGETHQDYDLEPTLYDLFVYYQGHYNASKAIIKISKLINENKKLNLVNPDGISSTLKPLF